MGDSLKWAYERDQRVNDPSRRWEPYQPTPAGIPAPKAFGFLTRQFPIPEGWTVEDERLHARCEFADERTMPPLPMVLDEDSLGRWGNDLASTHHMGDVCRIVTTLLRGSTDALSGVSETHRTTEKSGD